MSMRTMKASAEHSTHTDGSSVVLDSEKGVFREFQVMKNESFPPRNYSSRNFLIDDQR